MTSRKAAAPYRDAGRILTDLTDRLDEIEARADAATPGPWEWHPYMGSGATLAKPNHPFHELNILKTTDDWPPVAADAEFIAAARTDVPQLVAALRAVLDQHHRVDVGVIRGDCAREECDHEGACPEVPFAVCDACYSIADQIDPYLYERGGVDVVAWPCPTVQTIADEIERGES